MKKNNSKEPNIPFYDASCHAYNPMYETRKTIVGHSSNGPIYVEQELLVNSYCSLIDSYDFNCKDCPIFKAKMHSLKESDENDS